HRGPRKILRATLRRSRHQRERFRSRRLRLLRRHPSHLYGRQTSWRRMAQRSSPRVQQSGRYRVLSAHRRHALLRRALRLRLDSPSVPSTGTRVIATLSRVLQSPSLTSPIDQLEVQTSNFIPTGPKTSLFLNVSAGTTFHGTAGPFQVFALGGPFRLGAYFPQEFL